MSFDNYLRLRLTEALIFHQLFSQLDNSRLLWQDILSASIPNRKIRINLLLLGKTGNGKSATGNTALGRKVFESKASTSSVTTEVKCAQVELGDYVINIIDSPGLADTNFREKKVQEVEKCITNMEKVIKMCPGGIDAFMFVVKFGTRFTNEEQDTVKHLQQIFGPNFLRDYGIIVFTHGDDFDNAMEEEGMSDVNFHAWCRRQSGALGNLMKVCGYRCLLFNNREKDDKQKQKQMDSLVCLAMGFDDTYTFIDFLACQNTRHKLLLEYKAPELKRKFQSKINTLNHEIEQTCRSGNTSMEEFLRLKLEAVFLSREIDDEDNDTGLLRDLMEKVERSKHQILHYEERQAETRRREEESCTIL